MSQTKFTRLPWSLRFKPRNMLGEIVGPSLEHVCNVVIATEPIREEMLANAHLITAAPKLYDKLEVALRRLVEKDDGSTRDLGLISGIEAVLEEARGEL